MVLEAKKAVIHCEVDTIINLTFSELETRAKSNSFNDVFLSWKSFVVARRMLRKCFSEWKKYVERSKHEGKLNSFIEKLKEKKHSVAKPKPALVLKNRFEAQKSLILQQKTKLEEQTKLIEELKLGILREELFKSRSQQNIDIHELFKDCKSSSYVPKSIEQREKFMLETQKAPKIVQKMEQRALEREAKRQIIAAKKERLELERKEAISLALAQKKVLEEEERKRSLQVIWEKRQKDLKLQKLRQIHFLQFKAKEQKALNFHETTLKRTAWTKLFLNWNERKNKEILALQFSLRQLTRNCFVYWKELAESVRTIKEFQAQTLFEVNLLKKTFETFIELLQNRVKTIQTADDYNDLRITNRYFLSWQNNVCRIVIFREKQWKKAIQHYEKNLLVCHFYQWRTLKAVQQLEHIKEEKKRKWREKVWEILPDFQINSLN